MSETIDPLDKPYTLSQFLGVLRKERGIVRTYSTLYFWINVGIAPSREEARIKLKSRKIGGRAHLTLRIYDQWETSLG